MCKSMTIVHRLTEDDLRRIARDHEEARCTETGADLRASTWVLQVGMSTSNKGEYEFYDGGAKRRLGFLTDEQGWDFLTSSLRQILAYLNEEVRISLNAIEGSDGLRILTVSRVQGDLKEAFDALCEDVRIVGLDPSGGKFDFRPLQYVLARLGYYVEVMGVCSL